MEYLSFCERIRILSDKFACSATSWGRSDKRNKQVGGHPKSRHLNWCAVDIVLDDEADKFRFTELAKTLGLRVVDEQDHLHIQPEV